jgi:hypothetical protein
MTLDFDATAVVDRLTIDSQAMLASAPKERVLTILKDFHRVAHDYYSTRSEVACALVLMLVQSSTPRNSTTDEICDRFVRVANFVSDILLESINIDAQSPMSDIETHIADIAKK